MGRISECFVIDIAAFGTDPFSHTVHRKYILLNPLNYGIWINPDPIFLLILPEHTSPIKEVTSRMRRVTTGIWVGVSLL
jgi:hypothetical protein